MCGWSGRRGEGEAHSPFSEQEAIRRSLEESAPPEAPPTAEMDAGGNPKDIEKIYDYYDDNSLGFVNYGGWLDASGGEPTAVSATGTVLFTDSDGSEVLTYLEGEDLYVEVEDADRNEDESVSEVITLMVSSQTETGGEILTLIETGPNTGTFMGSMSFEEASANSGDGVLQVARGDGLTAAYLDPADDFGNEATITDVAYYRVTLKSGPLAESETWSPEGSPYLVTGDVTVASDQALTIDPGVEVRFTELSDDPGRGQ